MIPKPARVHKGLNIGVALDREAEARPDAFSRASAPVG